MTFWVLISCLLVILIAVAVLLFLAVDPIRRMHP